jgi:hypothetical protein
MAATGRGASRRERNSAASAFGILENFIATTTRGEGE